GPAGEVDGGPPGTRASGGSAQDAEGEGEFGGDGDGDGDGGRGDGARGGVGGGEARGGVGAGTGGRRGPGASGTVERVAPRGRERRMASAAGSFSASMARRKISCGTEGGLPARI